MKDVGPHMLIWICSSVSNALTDEQSLIYVSMFYLFIPLERAEVSGKTSISGSEI